MTKSYKEAGQLLDTILDVRDISTRQIPQGLEETVVVPSITALTW
jgi:hypothetical protein